MRSDIIGILIKGYFVYLVVVAIKFYSALTHEKNKSNETSSDDRRCFLKVVSGKNDSAENYQKQFENLLYPQRTKGMLRIHLVIPGVQGGTPKTCVEGEDVLVYIDVTNVDSFFTKIFLRMVTYRL